MGGEQNRLVIFEAAGQPVEVRVDAGRDTVWLSQRQMAEVFETTTDNISLRLKNIYAESELGEETTTEDSLVVGRVCQWSPRVCRWGQVSPYNIILNEFRPRPVRSRGE